MAAAGEAGASAAAAAVEVDQTLNPLVAGLKVSKTMALTDMARSMREAGIDVSSGVCVCVCVRVCVRVSCVCVCVRVKEARPWWISKWVGADAPAF
jgi:hypothetical protein